MGDMPRPNEISRGVQACGRYLLRSAPSSVRQGSVAKMLIDKEIGPHEEESDRAQEDGAECKYGEGGGGVKRGQRLTCSVPIDLAALLAT
eukprot:scaffold233456_cov28-Tisochrysis_lutea.AAC.3